MAKQHDGGPASEMTVRQVYESMAMEAIIKAAYSSESAFEIIQKAAKKCGLNFYDMISGYATAHADSMLAAEQAEGQDK